MADVTNLFKATVKSIKSRNRNSVLDTGTDSKTNIFPSKKVHSDFESTSKELVIKRGERFAPLTFRTCPTSCRDVSDFSKTK